MDLRSPLAGLVSAALIAACSPGGQGGGTPSSASPPPPTGTGSGTGGPTGTSPGSTATGPDRDADGAIDAVDCADDDPGSFPGNVEIACDGRDNDCADGDDRRACEIPLDSADYLIPRTGLPHNAGPGISVVADLTGDGVDDLVAVSQDSVFVARIYSFTGPTPTVPYAQLTSANDTFGWMHLTFPGDLTGDGYADLVVANAVLAGPFAGDFAPESSLTLAGGIHTDDWDRASISGDWDQDGAREFLSYTENGFDWVAPPFDGTGAWSEYVEGPEGNDLQATGMVLAALGEADLDGDGLTEFLGSWMTPDEVFDSDDAMHVFTGTPGPDPTWVTLAASYTQNTSNLWRWADVNGDGQIDLVAVGGGAVEVAYGPIALAGAQTITELADLTMPISGSGNWLEVVADVEGDGTATFLLGCDDHVVVGSLATPGSLDAACDAGREIAVPAFPQGLHRWLAGGDLDGDGLGDVVVTDGDAAVFRVWLGSTLATL